MDGKSTAILNKMSKCHDIFFFKKTFSLSITVLEDYLAQQKAHDNQI